MAAVQNAVTIEFNRIPPLLESQPPTITRGCLICLVAIELCGVLDGAHIYICTYIYIYIYVCML